MTQAISKDGTSISYERTGGGPALILVDGALCSRAFGPMPKLAPRYFMRSMVGAPAPFVVMMQLMPWIWRKMKAVAHTLPYDAAVMTGFEVPTRRLATITIPTLVMHGSKTDPRIQKAAMAVADAVPHAQHRILAGQTHNVVPGVLAAAVVEFFMA